MTAAHVAAANGQLPLLRLLHSSGDGDDGGGLAARSTAPTQWLQNSDGTWLPAHAKLARTGLGWLLAASAARALVAAPVTVSTALLCGAVVQQLHHLGSTSMADLVAPRWLVLWVLLVTAASCAYNALGPARIVAYLRRALLLTRAMLTAMPRALLLPTRPTPHASSPLDVAQQFGVGGAALLFLVAECAPPGEQRGEAQALCAAVAAADVTAVQHFVANGARSLAAGRGWGWGWVWWGGVG